MVALLVPSNGIYRPPARRPIRTDPSRPQSSPVVESTGQPVPVVSQSSNAEAIAQGAHRPEAHFCAPDNPRADLIDKFVNNLARRTHNTAATFPPAGWINASQYPETYYVDSCNGIGQPPKLRQVVAMMVVTLIRSSTGSHNEHYQTLYFLMRLNAIPAASCVNRLNRSKMARETIPEPAG